MTKDEILNLKMDSDIGTVTIRDYLRKLLITLWREQESFSGKRPFGNSGWDYDVYKPLIIAGIVNGTLDEEGYIEKFDSKEEQKAHTLIIDLIDYIFEN